MSKYEQDWPHHCPSTSLHMILLQPNGGTRGSWSSTRPACRFHRARGLSTSPADPQRRSLRRRGVSWDGRSIGLCSPHHGGRHMSETLGLQPWPVGRYFELPTAYINNERKLLTLVTLICYCPAFAGWNCRQVSERNPAPTPSCWQIQHQGTKQDKLTRAHMDVHKKPWHLNTTATWNIEIWTTGKCWDTSTPPGHTKSTADPFDGSVIIDPHG